MTGTRATGTTESKIVEEFSNPETEVFEALRVLASVEKSDEAAPLAVATKAANEIASLAATLKTQTVVLHSFAHLFGELSSPQTAMDALKATEANLRQKKLNVIRTPFGWFNTLDIQAKGHPLSRSA